MSAKDYTFPVPKADGVFIVQWAGLTKNDTGTPVRIPFYTDKSVQIGTVGGNTDAGSTTVFQGSNDPLADPDAVGHADALWFTLTDPQGNSISRTNSAIIEQVMESPLWVRPSNTGVGAIVVDIDVVLTCKGAR